MPEKKLCVGCKLPVRAQVEGTAEERIGEIVAIREKEDNQREYYVHYVGFNKRLDEWVQSEQLNVSDPEKVEYPKKKKASTKKKAPSKRKEEEKEERESTSALSLSVEDIYKIKNIEKVHMGSYTLNAWYFSPYPYALTDKKSIYLCEFCLFYFGTEDILNEHSSRCQVRRPPGAQIYRKEGISFFELDGKTHVNYARNLSLLSKLFLDHKTLYYDIDVFLFYVMCIYNVEEAEEERRYRIVGYFSKEKESQHGYNVACVLILPQYQRKGYGRLLIDFSYLLSRKERVAASPEKPLSDLGLLSYRQYWVEKIVEILLHSKTVSVNDIRDMSSITAEDIIHTLQAYKMLMFYNGVPIFFLRDELLQKHNKMQGTPKLDPDYLVWEPV